MKILDNQQRCIQNNYQGYYNEHFLRSSYEYMLAKYLEYRNIKFKVEFKKYYYKGKRISPDFFIFDSNNKLRCIVEVKPKRLVTKQVIDNIQILKLLEKVPIILLTEDSLKIKLARISCKFYSMVKEWKLLANKTVCIGSTNPMYGKKHSITTKNLISEKAKKRFKDNPEFLKNLVENCTVERIELICKTCNKKFYILPCRLKRKYKRGYCSVQCSTVENKKRSIKALEILRDKQNFTRQEMLPKFFKIISAINFESISYSKLNSTFWSYLKNLMNEYNIKDYRTFIKIITNKNNINSRTFVTSLRGHRNGTKPFWFSET